MGLQQTLKATIVEKLQECLKALKLLTEKKVVGLGVVGSVEGRFRGIGRRTGFVRQCRYRTAKRWTKKIAFKMK